MKSFFEEYSKVIGMVALTFVLIILFSSPSMLLAKPITVIDTELAHATGGEISVRTKMDLGNNEHVRAFPNAIGCWTGSDFNTTRIEQLLGADVMLLRAYSHPKLFQPVFFLIMQSGDRASFHPPTVCYPALGFTIEEVGNVMIPVHDVSWMEGPLFATRRDKANESVYFSAKKLIVTKESKGEVTERRVVLYYFVKESPFFSDTVTMVRVSALAPLEGCYNGILNFLI